MKFTLNRPLAIQVLGQALQTCNVKQKDKIESEICFKFENGDLRVYSMDAFAEQHLVLPVTDITGEEGESFSAFGPAVVDFFKAFTPSNGSEDVVCGYLPEKKALTLMSVDKKTKMVFMTRDGQFVPMRFKQEGASVAIEGKALAMALSHTAYAAHTNPAWSPQTAVKVTVEGSTIRAIATDEHRIASYAVEMEGHKVSRPIEILLPRTVAETLSTLLGTVLEVTLTMGEAHVRFEWDGGIFQSTLEPAKDVPYPQVEQYLLGRESAHAVVDKGSIVQALKRAVLIAKDSSIKITIDQDARQIKLNTKERDRGMSEDEIDAQDATVEQPDGRQGGQLSQSVQYKYLQKAVDSLPEAVLDISFRELKGAGYVVVLNDAARKSEHLVFGATAPDEGVSA
jgi:DNA polymerase III subunit beta